MDVKIVLLHGNLEKDIYMVWLYGFVLPRKEEEVYRLKQFSRQWYKKFDSCML